MSVQRKYERGLGWSPKDCIPIATMRETYTATRRRRLKQTAFFIASNTIVAGRLFVTLHTPLLAPSATSPRLFRSELRHVLAVDDLENPLRFVVPSITWSPLGNFNVISSPTRSCCLGDEVAESQHMQHSHLHRVTPPKRSKELVSEPEPNFHHSIVSRDLRCGTAQHCTSPLRAVGGRPDFRLNCRYFSRGRHLPRPCSIVRLHTDLCPKYDPRSFSLASLRLPKLFCNLNRRMFDGGRDAQTKAR